MCSGSIHILNRTYSQPYILLCQSLTRDHFLFSFDAHVKKWRALMPVRPSAVRPSHIAVITRLSDPRVLTCRGSVLKDTVQALEVFTFKITQASSYFKVMRLHFNVSVTIDQTSSSTLSSIIKLLWWLRHHMWHLWYFPSPHVAPIIMYSCLRVNLATFSFVRAVYLPDHLIEFPKYILNHCFMYLNCVLE